MTPVARSLVRGIGRWDLVAILINVVIGAGIMGLPAKSFALIGSYSIVAWVVCALIMGVVAACFAEVGSRFAQTGGPYLYAHAAFGPAVGFLVGWLAWISRLFSFATIANLAVTYLGGAVPALMSGPTRATAIALATAVLTTLVLTGVRRSAHVNNALTACKLLVLVGFTIVCLPFVDSASLVPSGTTSVADWQAAIMLMTFAFLGIESAMITAGEMKNPRADVPFGLGAALIVIALLYIAIQVVCIGTVPDLASSQRPLVDAATRTVGPVGAYLVSAGALVTMLGSMFAIMLTGSRLPFAFAEQGQLPRVLCSIHERFRTPHVAILVTGLCAGVLAIYCSFMGALVVSALTRLVGYVTTCAALVVLRSRDAGVGQPGFRVPAGPLVAATGVGACMWLMLGSSSQELLSLAAVTLTGAVAGGGYILFRRRNRLPSPVGEPQPRTRGADGATG